MLNRSVFQALCVTLFVAFAHHATAQESAKSQAPSALKPAASTAKPLLTAPANKTDQIPATPLATDDILSDRSQMRVDAEKSLKDLLQVAEKELTATQKSLRDLWTQRVQLLDEWDKAAKALQSAKHPKPTPENEAADRNAELSRSTAQYDLITKSVDGGLPPLFRLPFDKIDELKLNEMREAIAAAKSAQQEKSTEVERLRGEPAARKALMTDLRAARDKIHAQIAGLPTRRAQYESEIFKAKTEDARKIARAYYLNFHCESGIIRERLALTEACIELETRRAVTWEIATKASSMSLALANAQAKLLSDRYKGIAERQKADLNLAAKTEAKKAATVEDPIAKYKAFRTAELLQLQAQILEDDKALSTSPTLSLEEQKTLADRAQADFSSLQQVVKEDKVGGLVALRLNNDFRLISRELSNIARNELAAASQSHTFYENALTEAELTYINDARDDRFERDSFVKTLPKERWPAANATIDELEKKHRELLSKHKEVLGKLLTRAEDIHKQVTRRLSILEDHYAFIRTNIFWVRDSEALSKSTLVQARKEVARLLAAVGGLIKDPFDRSQWSVVSVECAIAFIGLLALPLVIIKLRSSIKASLC
jgi:hypothetical protein